MNIEINRAVINVDVQNDFISGSLAVKDGEQVVDPLNRISTVARSHGWLIFDTRDWHPRKTSHFKQFGGLWPDHCVEDTWGAQFHQDLNLEGSTVVSKGMGEAEDAYSGFEARDEKGTLLEELLREKKVEEVYVGGLATDYCVKATAIGAARRGFKTYLLLDACRAVNIDPEDEKKAIDEMIGEGVIITDIQSVIEGRI